MNARPPSRHALLLPLFALHLLWSPAATAESRSAARTVITIGVAGPMSGGMAELGRDVRQAVEVQVEQWNERGGLLGRRIHLVVEDDRDDPTEAVAVATRLVRAGVWGVIGHLTSSASLPASRIYHAAEVPQITPSSTDPRLTEQRFRNLFRTCGRDDRQGEIAAEFVIEALDPRRVVVVHDTTRYGEALAASFRRRVGRTGRRQIVGTFPLSSGTRNLASVAEQVKALAPDVVYFGGIFREGGLLLRRLREQGVTAAFVSGDGVIGAEFVSLAGEAAATGAYLTFAPNPMTLPSAQSAIRRFQQRYGAIGPYTLYAYDAAGALLTAIATAKPRAPSRAQLRRVSESLHNMTYAGALGKLRWDRNGDLIDQPYVVYRARKGGDFQGWFEQVTGRRQRL